MMQRMKEIPHNLIFFLFGALYLWLVTEPRLIYQCFGTILPEAPVFLTGWAFLEESLALPGGFVMYVSGFLSQGYYHSLLGSVIITLSAFCLCELSRRHLVAAGYGRATVLSAFPAILLFLIYSRYEHPLPGCLTVSLGLLYSLIFERLAPSQRVVRGAAYCLMAAALFWLAGGGGLLIFSLMTVIYGTFIHRNFALAVLALPAAFVIVSSLALYVFFIPPQEAFFVLAPMGSTVTGGIDGLSRVLVVILYGFVPLSALVALLVRGMLRKTAQERRKRSKRTKTKKARSTTEPNRLSPPILRRAAVATIPVVLMAAGLYFSRDQTRKPFVLAHDLSLRKQWQEILDLSRNLPKDRSSVYFHHDVIRALYHTGRLPYDVFQFPQIPHGLLLTHEENASHLTQLKLCDFFIELGRLNMAQKLASEILATKNHSGIVVEKLAWINIIKGQSRTARVYLNALKKDPIYRGTAVALLSALDDGFSPDQAAYIDRIRSYMYVENHVATGDESIERVLTGLLAHNPHNKMAFEYLMACYLLAGQVDKVAANMERLAELRYRTVPTLYQEAVLIHLSARGQKVEAGKFNITPETIERGTRFVQLVGALRTGNRPAVFKRLVSEFGSSYFFYCTFHRVGLQ